ncbi:MAG: hypothetical protein LBD02_11075 [Christensenellaceae bacterium]|jgi:hypothetical protein|nr:hypothetical protein [Christensenellaceae bacterium]
MQGYDQDAALAFISARVRPGEHRAFSESELRSLLRLALEADLQYMEENGVLSGGLSGGSYYDDDEAFEFIDAALCRAIAADDDKAMAVAALVDDFMEQQQAYMEEVGLLEWE